MHLSNMQLWVSLKTDIFLCVHDCAFGVQVARTYVARVRVLYPQKME